MKICQCEPNDFIPASTMLVRSIKVECAHKGADIDLSELGGPMVTAAYVLMVLNSWTNDTDGSMTHLAHHWGNWGTPEEFLLAFVDGEVSINWNRCPESEKVNAHGIAEWAFHCSIPLGQWALEQFITNAATPVASALDVSPNALGKALFDAFTSDDVDSE